MKLGFGLAAWALALRAAAAPVDVVRVEASEPRAYGYQVGDRVARQVSVHAPQGWRLDPASVPRPGGRGQPLELQRVALTTRSEAGGQRHQLALEYQVFLAPAAVRTLEIAPFRLRFEGPQRSAEVLVEAWPVTVAPLVPVAVSPRRGLGEMQPDRPPPRIDTRPQQLRLLATAVAATLLLVWLAVAILGPPWRASRNQPFGRAWRQLRNLGTTPDAAQWRAACRHFHAALNRSAGEVLFEPGLDRFLAARPAFRGLRDELVRFMRMSRSEFFADAPRSAHDAAWLVGLCRRCHDAERGLA